MILTYQKINEETLITATKIQYKIFLQSCAYDKYLNQVENNEGLPQDYLAIYKD